MSLTKHGEATFRNRTVEYTTWLRMKQRCFDRNHPFYKDYGGRGISIFKPWAKSYEKFLNDVGRRPTSNHSIDRIDNSKGYEPGNVRWATRVEQLRNRRNTKMVTINGVTKDLSFWVERFGAKYSTVFKRLKLGWNPKRALSEPVKPNYSRIIKIGHVSKCITEWSRYTGIELTLIINRIKRGWNVRDAVFKHPKKNESKGV